MKNSPSCFGYALPNYRYHLNGLNEASNTYVPKVRAFSLHDMSLRFCSSYDFTSFRILNIHKSNQCLST